jgi:hypothetical protein
LQKSDQPKAARSKLFVKDRTKLDGKLCAAVKTRNNKELEILLRKAADPEAATSLEGHGNCAVLFAACSGQGNYATVFSLLSYGADPNRMNGRPNETALLAACGTGAQSAIVYLLLRAGADINAETIYGETPLCHACACRAGIGVVRMLLQGGADANPRRAPYQYLPLCQAAAKGDSDIVSLLLSYGADLDWALRSACSSLESRAIRPLLEPGGTQTGGWGRLELHIFKKRALKGMSRLFGSCLDMELTPMHRVRHLHQQVKQHLLIQEGGAKNFKPSGGAPAKDRSGEQGLVEDFEALGRRFGRTFPRQRGVNECPLFQ